jgi:hypothetical protein
MAVPIRSIKFWINAFIPANIPGYTMPVPGRGGETMIPGPPEPGVSAGAGAGWYGYVPYAYAYAYPTLTSYGYHTDNRTFNNDIRASSRMHCECTVDMSLGQPVMTQYHRCDQTIAYNKADGSIAKTGYGEIKRMGFQLSSIDRDTVRIKMKYASSNPCVPPSKRIADINFFGDILIDFGARFLMSTVFLDNFPAFEAYATINDGAGVKLFHRMPEKGSTVVSLVGFAGIIAAASRKEEEKLVDEDQDGVFEPRY